MTHSFPSLRRGVALAVLLTASSLASRAQGVRIGTAGAPDPSAVLDLVSGTQGALLPRVAATTDVAGPATGLIVYQTGGTAGYYYYTGSSWQLLATDANLTTVTNRVANTENTVAALGTQLSTKLTLPALTSGSVLFSNGSTIAQKNARFFWDNTANRLGVGTSAPTSTLQVAGTVAVGVTLNIPGGNGPGGNALANYPGSYLGLNPAGTNSDNYFVLPDPAACAGRVYYLRNNSDTFSAYLGTAGGSIYPASSSTATTTTNLYRLAPNGAPKTVIALSDGLNWTVGYLN